MTEVGAEAVCAPGQVMVPEGDGWFCAGSAWAAYGDVLAARCGLSGACDSDARVHAQDVARVAAMRFAAGGAVPAEQALPVYLRDEVAWAKRT